MPCISIIVPVYNAEMHLEECINSILSSSFNDFELILVDDGSTDSSLQICKNYEMNYENIRVIHKKNGGVSEARNIGVSESISKYVVFVDADDTIEPNFLEEIISYDVDFVLTGYTEFSGDYYKKNECPEYEGSIREFARMIEKWFNPPYLLSPWCKLFKVSIIDDYNIQFPREMSYGEDVSFVFQYLQYVDTVKCIKYEGYNYRVDLDNSLSGRFKEDMFSSCKKYNQEISRFMRMHDPDRCERFAEQRLVHDFTGYTRKLILSNLKYSEKKAIFYRLVKENSIGELFLNNSITIKSEKIVALAIKKKVLFPILLLFYI